MVCKRRFSLFALNVIVKAPFSLLSWEDLLLFWYIYKGNKKDPCFGFLFFFLFNQSRM